MYLYKLKLYKYKYIKWFNNIINFVKQMLSDSFFFNIMILLQHSEGECLSE